MDMNSQLRERGAERLGRGQRRGGKWTVRKRQPRKGTSGGSIHIRERTTDP